MENTMSGKKQMPARVLMHCAVLSGRLSLIAFVIFLFSGPFDLAIMTPGHSGWLFWDVLLSSLFFVQHTGMIRRSNRARLGRRIPDCYHGAVFTLAASFVLGMAVVFWQSSALPILEVRGPLRWLLRGMFFAGAAGIVWGFLSIKDLDPYGVAPIKAQLSGKSLRPMPLSIQGPYRWVRHPMYFFVLVMLWSCPDLTADRLLFNVLWTGWIVAGTVLEEKDLLSAFGDDYRRYQSKVPMLIPWKGYTNQFHFTKGER